MVGVSVSFISSGTQHWVARTIPNSQLHSRATPRMSFRSAWCVLHSSSIPVIGWYICTLAEPKDQSPSLQWVSVSEYWLLMSANATERPVISLHPGRCNFRRAILNEPDSDVCPVHLCLDCSELLPELKE
jgi:hypothetical protein